MPANERAIMATTQNPPPLTVRPELAESVLHMLDEGADQYDGDLVEITALFRSLAESIRAGEPIDLMPYATSQEAEKAAENPDWYAYRVGSQLTLEASYAFEPVGPFSEPDWRYLSDLAGFAADIEAALA